MKNIIALLVLFTFTKAYSAVTVLEDASFFLDNNAPEFSQPATNPPINLLSGEIDGFVFTGYQEAFFPLVSPRLERGERFRLTFRVGQAQQLLFSAELTDPNRAGMRFTLVEELLGETLTILDTSLSEEYRDGGGRLRGDEQFDTLILLNPGDYTLFTTPYYDFRFDPDTADTRWSMEATFTTVPLPAAIYLFGAAFLGLFGFRGYRIRR